MFQGCLSPVLCAAQPRTDIRIPGLGIGVKRAAFLTFLPAFFREARQEDIKPNRCGGGAHEVTEGVRDEVVAGTRESRGVREEVNGN